MVDYYSTSLEKFSHGVISEYTKLPEKFRYLVIMLKLFIELETLFRAIAQEKKSILEYNVNFLDEELLLFDQRVSSKYE